MRTKEGNKEKDILEAAIKVFAQNGYHNAKIYQIAQEAGVATGSVYVYYENKEHLLLRIFEKLWKKLYSEMNSLVLNKEFSPLEKIDSMIDLLIDLFAENPSLAMVYVNEQNHIERDNKQFTKFYNKFLDLGEVVIKQGIDHRDFSQNLDLEVFRHFIVGALRMLLHRWAESPEDFPLNRIRRNIKYLIKHGILKKED